MTGPGPVAEPMTTDQASAYQQLRAHLAYLKLGTAAENLPEVLDAARTEGLSPTVAMERLLNAEVKATEARKLSTRLCFASLPAPEDPGRVGLRRQRIHRRNVDPGSGDTEIPWNKPATYSLSDRLGLGKLISR